MPKQQAEEFFYLDADGNRHDRELHAAIIGPVDHPIDEEIMAPIRARHRAAYLKQKAWQRAKARALTLLSARGSQQGQNGLDKAWDEDEHPRHPAGSPQGGQFAPAGGGGGSGVSGQSSGERPEAGAGDDAGVSGAFRSESPRDADRLRRAIVAVHTPSAATATALKDRGADAPTYHELSGDAKGAAIFRDAILAAKASNDYGAAVTAYEADEYLGARLFMTPDGLNGFALRGDDIISLFKHDDSKTKKVAIPSLMLATQLGGRRLDAFDTVLPKIYKDSGFAEAARLKFNDEYAPPGWDYDTFKEFNGGRPDVVFMVYDPERINVGKGAYVQTYDEGLAAQDTLLSYLKTIEDARVKQAAHVRAVLATARDVAKEFDFDPSKVSIGASASPDATFTLNGKQYKAAGLAYIHSGPLEGQVKLFPEQIANTDIARGVTVHEIEHHKFQNALDRYRVEQQLINKLDVPTKDLMRADGSLKPPYDTKYPAYTAMQKVMEGNQQAFADSDGVSDYSFEYWKGWKAGTVRTESAMHETLAEMARLKDDTGKFPEHMGERVLSYRGDKPKPSQKEIDANAKRWRDLYRAVEKLW